MGVADQGMGINSAWISPVLQELSALLGPNFDPLPGWTGQHERLLSAEAQHLQPKWWSAGLGKRVMTRLLDTSSPRDEARLLEEANSDGHDFMAVPPNADVYYTLQGWAGYNLEVIT